MSTASTGKPVVLIAEELSPATVEALGPDFEIRSCNGADRAELLPAIADVDAILVRSATKVDAEAIAVAKNLKVVARAGVGLDNVDVPAATKAGVMVVNAPTSNIVTAAELACGLLVATARNIPQANAALKNGEWKRSKYTGVELSEKTLGVVGLGRIGVLVAQRMSAFGMKIVAYDPYIQPARAAQMGVKLLSLDELLEVSDFITVHLPKTPETVGLIGDEALHKVKPEVRIVNAARGGIVDEEALAAALKEGRVAAAGLDVFSKEPCTDSPLFEFDNVVVTPHLGASTGEAQEKAGIAVARSVRLALAGELVPDAVNVRPKHQQKIVAVGEYDVDLALADHMAFLRYTDRPGVVGTLGRILGEAEINIAGMQVSRSAVGGAALVALTVDDTIPQPVLTEIAEEIGASSARSVNLVN
ncbi:NAD(P)-dependent oxidoreductase [Streptomyces sp. MCAF7]